MLDRDRVAGSKFLAVCMNTDQSEIQTLRLLGPCVRRVHTWPPPPAAGLASVDYLKDPPRFAIPWSAAAGNDDRKEMADRGISERSLTDLQNDLLA